MLMLKKFKRRFYCLTLLLLSLNCAAKQGQKVTLLADDSYPPYSYLADGEMKGIYVDLVRLAAEELTPHYEIEIIAVPWKRGLNEIKKGSAFALIPPYKHIEKRPYIWPYSISLLSETVVAFCHQDINVTDFLYSDTEFKGAPLNIGLNSGYAIINKEIELAQARGSVKLWENKDTGANILKLLRKRIDCYLNDRFSTLWEVKRLNKMFPDNRYNFSSIEEALVVMTRTTHIGYSDSNNSNYPFKEDFIKRMDEALSNLYTSEQYHQILAEYIEP